MSIAERFDEREVDRFLSDDTPANVYRNGYVCVYVGNGSYHVAPQYHLALTQARETGAASVDVVGMYGQILRLYPVEFEAVEFYPVPALDCSAAYGAWRAQREEERFAERDKRGRAG